MTRSALAAVLCLVPALTASAQQLTCEEGKARLEDPNENVRTQALNALTRCPDVVEQLADALGRPKVDQISVVNALGAMGPKAAAALPALEKVRQRGGDLSLYAAMAIATIDPSKTKEVAPTWLKFLDHREPYMVAVALELLSRPDAADLVPFAKAVKLARSKDEQIRMHALNVLEARARSAEAEKLAVAAVKRCKGAQRECAEGEENACQYVADFDGDAKPDTAVRIVMGGKKALAVVARNRCHVWTPASPDGAGWSLAGDERGGPTQLNVTSAEGQTWVVGLKKGKLRGVLQEY